MDELLFLKIIDLVKDYGLQVIGIIIIIFLSKLFIQAILWVIKIAVFIILGIVHFLFVIIRFILTILPAGLQDKLNKVIYKIESLIRNMENVNQELKEWFASAPGKYAKVHQYIIKGIRSLIGLAFVFSIVVLVVNVFIQKSLTVEQIVNYLG